MPDPNLSDLTEDEAFASLPVREYGRPVLPLPGIIMIDMDNGTEAARREVLDAMSELHMAHGGGALTWTETLLNDQTRRYVARTTLELEEAMRASWKIIKAKFAAQAKEEPNAQT